MGFSRQEYWNGLPFPPPGDLPDPRIKPTSPMSPALQADSLPAEPLGKPSQEAFKFPKGKNTVSISGPTVDRILELEEALQIIDQCFQLLGTVLPLSPGSAFSEFLPGALLVGGVYLFPLERG